ncbi:MAG: phosphohydrolase [Candidatus Liptonbacteria bacterium]|nr:phosphohydrolase [Candidatus Liptonbacteria bacterium]
MKKIIVLYHGKCDDGFGAAWAAWKKFGSRASYIPLEHQKPPPAGLKGKELYFLDFTYPASITKKLIRENKRVTAVDHHISAKEAVFATYRYLFDIKHSAAVLSWKYFHPRKSAPKLLRHIEDIDLWKFKLPRTREIIAFLETNPFDFKVWDRVRRGLDKPKTRKLYIEEGKRILIYQEKLIEHLTESADLVNFAGRRVFIVNSPVFNSQIGHLLIKKRPPIGIVWSAKDGTIRVSLRSNSKVDVSKIAKKFGGGGHKNAAGFSLREGAKLPWKRIKN